MQQDITILWQAGSFSLSNYGMMIAGGVLLGVMLTLILHRKDLYTALSVSLCSILGGLIGGHVLWCLVSMGKLPDYESGYSLIALLNLGGYWLPGAVIGMLIAIALYGAVTRKSIPVLFDMAVPGGLLALCVERAAEVFTTQGLGEFIEDEFLMRFPFGIAIGLDEDWVDWRVPVFIYEAAAAAILLILALILLKKLTAPGRLTCVTLTLLCAAQIFLEQLRSDDFLAFGFVRVTQVVAILGMLVILLINLIATVKRDGWRAISVLRLVLLPMCALTVIFIEFAFEKGWVVPYLCITLMVTSAVGACALIEAGSRSRRSRSGHGRATLCFLLTALEVAFCVWVVWAVNQEFDWENMMLQGVMGLTMIAAAAAVLLGDKEQIND